MKAERTGDLNDDIAHLAGFVTAWITGDFKGGSPAPERLLEMADDGARAKLAVQLIEALAPATPEPAIWAHWLNGGTSPKAALDVAQFDPRNAPSSRKIKGAAGHYSDARKKGDRARGNLEKARAELAAAEQAVRDAEEQEKRAAAMAQGAVIWAILRTIADTSNAIFAMRAAGPLMRAISPFPTAAELEAQGTIADTPEASEAAKQSYKEQREEDYREFVDALNFFDGDLAFQEDLRCLLRTLVQDHNTVRRPRLEASGWKPGTQESDSATERPEAKVWSALMGAALKKTSRSSEARDP